MERNPDQDSEPQSQSGRPVLVTAAIAVLVAALVVMLVIGIVLN